MTRPDPIVVQLSKAQAVELIASLAAQLGNVALPYQMRGATTSLETTDGQRVVVAYVSDAALTAVSK